MLLSMRDIVYGRDDLTDRPALHDLVLHRRAPDKKAGELARAAHPVFARPGHADGAEMLLELLQGLFDESLERLHDCLLDWRIVRMIP